MVADVYGEALMCRECALVLDWIRRQSLFSFASSWTTHELSPVGQREMEEARVRWVNRKQDLQGVA